MSLVHHGDYLESVEAEQARVHVKPHDALHALITEKLYSTNLSLLVHSVKELKAATSTSGGVATR